MTTLHDRLADLADEAPTGGPVPDLWTRGRRVHRRRQAGTVIIAVVVLLVIGSLGASSWLKARPDPAPAGGSPALPDRIWMPSRWLPGTDDAGELGQLAAVQYAERSSWNETGEGVAGISATTGEYRFLDLPDASQNEVALAPDGRHVAYWYTGATRLSPNSASGPVVGVAVYDTTTGEVVRYAVPTDHGLMTGGVETLAWADDDRLVLSYAQYRGGDADSSNDRSSAANGPGILVWEPGSGRAPTLLRGIDGTVDSSTGDGEILLLDFPRMTWIDLDDPAHAVSFRGPNVLGVGDTAVDTSGTRLAGPLGNHNPAPISVLRIRPDGTTTPAREVPESGRTFAVRAWLDGGHVAADRRRIGSGIGPSALYDVDLRTGESAEILRFPDDTYGTRTLLATDLLEAPSVTRPAPPRPLDPRKVAALEASVIVLGLGAVLVWRRRVRA